MQETRGEPAGPQEAQRRNILAGARRAFARGGAATTMADVARAAGVSQGLAYRYFASKDELVRELVESALAQAAPPQPAAGATPGERLRLLVAALVEQRRDNLELAQLLDQLLGSGGAPESVAELIRQHRAALLGELRRLIVEGQASGEVAAGDPDQLVVAVAATLEGLTRFGLHDPELLRRLCPEPAIVLRMLMP